jgi:hypothetical protein
VAVLPVVQVSDTSSAHRTSWLSDQLSVRNYEAEKREGHYMGVNPRHGEVEVQHMLKGHGLAVSQPE